MAVKIMNDCCDCATPSYPCRGSLCPLRHATHYFCDVCKDDVEKIYRLFGKDYCVDCLSDNLDELSEKLNIEIYGGD